MLGPPETVGTCGMACRNDALRLLLLNNYPAKQIAGVDVDSILWVSQVNKAHTAWLYRDPKGKLHIHDELGFQAERTNTKW